MLGGRRSEPAIFGRIQPGGRCGDIADARDGEAPVRPVPCHIGLRSAGLGQGRFGGVKQAGAGGIGAAIARRQLQGERCTLRHAQRVGTGEPGHINAQRQGRARCDIVIQGQVGQQRVGALVDIARQTRQFEQRGRGMAQRADLYTVGQRPVGLCRKAAIARIAPIAMPTGFGRHADGDARRRTGPGRCAFGMDRCIDMRSLRGGRGGDHTRQRRQQDQESCTTAAKESPARQRAKLCGHCTPTPSGSVRAMATASCRPSVSIAPGIR